VSINALIATVFGIGRVPKAPGTAGSLAAMLIAWPIAVHYGHWMLAPLGLGIGLIGIYFSGMYARECGVADPKSCVIDEVAGQWIALSVAPITPLAYLAAFGFFRFFDIRKIWPVDKVEELKGGLGIVADDIVAGVMAAMAVLIFVNAGLLK
jgi:phosphatidylglycerophosphatase A